MNKRVNAIIAALAWVIVALGLAMLVSGCAPSEPVYVEPTEDPYVALADAQNTAEAANNKANFYSMQMTSTAQAPLVAMTATAAAWEMEQKYAAAT